jgi:hypothetical protein
MTSANEADFVATLEAKTQQRIQHSRVWSHFTLGENIGECDTASDARLRYEQYLLSESHGWHCKWSVKVDDRNVLYCVCGVVRNQYVENYCVLSYTLGKPRVVDAEIARIGTEALASKSNGERVRGIRRCVVLPAVYSAENRGKISSFYSICRRTKLVSILTAISSSYKEMPQVAFGRSFKMNTCPVQMA